MNTQIMFVDPKYISDPLVIRHVLVGTREQNVEITDGHINNRLSYDT